MKTSTSETTVHARVRLHNIIVIHTRQVPLFLASSLYRSLVITPTKSNGITMARSQGLAHPRSLVVCSSKALLQNYQNRNCLSKLHHMPIRKPTVEMSTYVCTDIVPIMFGSIPRILCTTILDNSIDDLAYCIATIQSIIYPKRSSTDEIRLILVRQHETVQY